jgi:hypothetical protein
MPERAIAVINSSNLAIVEQAQDAVRVAVAGSVVNFARPTVLDFISVM